MTFRKDKLRMIPGIGGDPSSDTGTLTPEQALFKLLDKIEPQLKAVYLRTPQEETFLLDENPVVSLCQWAIALNQATRNRFASRYDGVPKYEYVNVRVNPSECSSVLFLEVTQYQNSQDGVEGLMIFITPESQSDPMTKADFSSFSALVEKKGDQWESAELSHTSYDDCVANLPRHVTLRQYRTRIIPHSLISPSGGQPIPFAA